MGDDCACCMLQGLNALHIAAQDGNIQQCRKLLKQGADVNARTEDVYVSNHCVNCHAISCPQCRHAFCKYFVWYTVN